MQNALKARQKNLFTFIYRPAEGAPTILGMFPGHPGKLSKTNHLQGHLVLFQCLSPKHHVELQSKTEQQFHNSDCSHPPSGWTNLCLSPHRSSCLKPRFLPLIPEAKIAARGCRLPRPLLPSRAAPVFFAKLEGTNHPC